jgi:predicted nucleic acid-binding protein
MSVYLDASVLIPLFVPDPHTARATALLRRLSEPLAISDLAAAEFASGISRLVRISDLDADEARKAFAGFDLWSERTSQRVELVPADLKAAESSLRRLDVPLTTPDVLHIAAALRLGFGLATFDDRMAASAKRLGASIVQA